jgi:hypothetical protein
MSKHKFQVGDLVFWRSYGPVTADIGLVIGIRQAYRHLHKHQRERVRILWLKSEDGIEYYDGDNSNLYTQQEWERLQNEQR